MANRIEIDIPGIGVVTANGAASEQTLREIADILGQQYSKAKNKVDKEKSRQQQNDQRASRERQAADEEVAEGARGTGRALSKTEIGLRKFVDSVKITGAQLSMMYKVGVNAANTLDDIAGIGDSLSKALNSLGNVPIVGTLMKDAFGPVVSNAEILAKTMHTIAAAGAGVPNSLFSLSNAASSTGLTLENFSRVVAQNTESLMILGGTTSKGLTKFAQASKTLRFSELGSTLMGLGYTTEDLSSGLGSYIKQVSKAGSIQNTSVEQLAQGAGNYLLQLDALARITGKTRKEMEDQKAAIANDRRVKALLLNADEQSRDRIHTMLAAVPEDLRAGMQDFIVTGGRPTTEAGKYFASTMGKTADMLLNMSTRASKGQVVTQKQTDAVLKMAYGESKNLVKQYGDIANFLPEEFAKLFNGAVEISRRSGETVGSVMDKLRKEAGSSAGNFALSMQMMQNKLAETSNYFTTLLASSPLLSSFAKSLEWVNATAKFFTPIFETFGSILSPVIDVINFFLIPVFQLLGSVVNFLLTPFKFFGDTLQLVSDLLTKSLDPYEALDRAVRSMQLRFVDAGISLKEFIYNIGGLIGMGGSEEDFAALEAQKKAVAAERAELEGDRLKKLSKNQEKHDELRNKQEKIYLENRLKNDKEFYDEKKEKEEDATSGQGRVVPNIPTWQQARDAYGQNPPTGKPVTSGEQGKSGTENNAGAVPKANIKYNLPPNAAKALEFFMSKGWTEQQAAGLVGNLQAESGKNLDIKAVGDSGKAYGIAQWHPDRQAMFKKQFGKNIQDSTLEEQLAFVDWELNNNEKRAGVALKNAKSAEQAAYVVDKLYERSSGAHLTQRIANAADILKSRKEVALDAANSQQGIADAVGDVLSNTQANLHSQTQAAIDQGIKYGFGSKNLANGAIDCSGWISTINTGLMNSVNQEVGKPVYGKQAFNAFKGSASDIIKNVSTATGSLMTDTNQIFNNLKEGMLIGEDNGAKGWDAGRFGGIDHIVQVVKDAVSGQLMISESTSGKGVKLSTPDEYQKRVEQKGKKLYATDPTKLADQTALASVKPKIENNVAETPEQIRQRTHDQLQANLRASELALAEDERKFLENKKAQLKEKSKNELAQGKVVDPYAEENKKFDAELAAKDQEIANIRRQAQENRLKSEQEGAKLANPSNLNPSTATSLGFKNIEMLRRQTEQQQLAKQQQQQQIEQQKMEMMKQQQEVLASNNPLDLVKSIMSQFTEPLNNNLQQLVGIQQYSADVGTRQLHAQKDFNFAQTGLIPT